MCSYQSNYVDIKKDDLLERSSEFTSIITNIAMDSQNIIRCEMNYKPLRPLIDSDIPADTFCCKDATRAGFYAYEDAGIVTGSFLASQSLCYKTTGDLKALENAQKAFDGIKFIYELGKQHREGFFPKPYDGKFSNHISRDQYLFVMAGLKEYYDIASDPLRSEIKQMMTKMVYCWIDMNYRHNYFSLPSASHLTDFMGSLFLGIVGVADWCAKDPLISNEYQRLLIDENLGNRMSETLRGLFLRGVKYDGAMYFRSHEHSMTMKTIAANILCEYDPQNIDLWLDSMQIFWNNDLQVSYDPSTGLSYFIIGFNPTDNSTFITNPGIINELENPLNIACLNWGGQHKTAISTMLALSAAMIGRWTKNEDAIKLGNSILGKITLEKCRGFVVPNSSHFPPGEQYRKNLLNTAWLCHWLWAYWTGKFYRLW